MSEINGGNNFKVGDMVYIPGHSIFGEPSKVLEIGEPTFRDADYTYVMALEGIYDNTRTIVPNGFHLYAMTPRQKIERMLHA
jgi:hypothetical protein